MFILKLVLLYSLKYEREKNSIGSLKSILRDKAKTEHARNLVSGIDNMISVCGSKARGGLSVCLFLSNCCC